MPKRLDKAAAVLFAAWAAFILWKAYSGSGPILRQGLEFLALRPWVGAPRAAPILEVIGAHALAIGALSTIALAAFGWGSLLLSKTCKFPIGRLERFLLAQGLGLGALALVELAILAAGIRPILATLGPVSAKPEMMRPLIAAGVDAFRLNCSHASLDELKRNVEMIRGVSRQCRRSVAVVMDLQGPRLRVGRLRNAEPVSLKKGARVIVMSHLGKGKPEDTLLPVAKYLDQKFPVTFLDQLMSPENARAVDAMRDGDVFLLENLRHNPGEEKNAGNLLTVFDFMVGQQLGYERQRHFVDLGGRLENADQ